MIDHNVRNRMNRCSVKYSGLMSEIGNSRYVFALVPRVSWKKVKEGCLLAGTSLFNPFILRRDYTELSQSCFS